MGKDAVKRRDELLWRSVFDLHELSKHFIEPGLLSKVQVEKLLKGAALCTRPPDHHVPWDEIAVNLPQAAYRKLEELNFKRFTCSIADCRTSEKKDTCKLLIRLQDGLEVETVLMRFCLDTGDKGELIFTDRSRSTVCVSSQVGCKMGCTFCATGTMGLSANLTSGEILEQIMLANQVERDFRLNEVVGQAVVSPKDGRYIRNVVFMGMGEPLDNYNEVIRSIRSLTGTKVFPLAPSRITVSTVGFSVARIRNLIEDVPRCSLALSLHAPTQALRDEIVPTSRGVDLRDLLDVCFQFVAQQKKLSKTNAKRQCLLVEYCIIADKNDSEDCARQLGELFKDVAEDVMVNLIPYNPTDVKANFKAPTEEAVDLFISTVRSYGVKVRVRQEHGRDIFGACGQLALTKKNSRNSNEDWALSEDPSELSEDESPRESDTSRVLTGSEDLKKTVTLPTDEHTPLSEGQRPAEKEEEALGAENKADEAQFVKIAPNPLRQLWHYVSGPADPEPASAEGCAAAAKERLTRRLLLGGGVFLVGALVVRQLLVSFDPPSNSSRRRRR